MPGGMTKADRERIRELFCHRKPSYSVADAVRLTASEPAQFEAFLSDYLARPITKETRVAWEDVAYFALERWTLRALDEVLLDVRDGCIPPLNHFATIEVRLPIYQIRVLHALALLESVGARIQRTASDLIERQVFDLVTGLDEDELEALVPGAVRAAQYPYYVRFVAVSRGGCHYCANPATTPSGACADCRALHEHSSAEDEVSRRRDDAPGVA